MKEIKMNQLHSGCEKKEKGHLYKIGMFANMNRVTIKTLRYYDEQKLLVPAYVDEENGYRYYAAGQMARLQRIISLKNMGFVYRGKQNLYADSTGWTDFCTINFVR